MKRADGPASATYTAAHLIALMYYAGVMRTHMRVHGPAFAHSWTLRWNTFQLEHARA